MKHYLKCTEVAKALRITTQTVRRMIKRGELKAVQVGARQRIDSEEFERFLNEKAA